MLTTIVRRRYNVEGLPMYPFVHDLAARGPEALKTDDVAAFVLPSSSYGDGRPGSKAPAAAPAAAVTDGVVKLDGDARRRAPESWWGLLNRIPERRVPEKEHELKKQNTDTASFWPREPPHVG